MRIIKTFEPEKDVLRMLERATRDGIRLTHIFNSGTRAWLISKGYARKKDIASRPAQALDHVRD